MRLHVPFYGFFGKDETRHRRNGPYNILLVQGRLKNGEARCKSRYKSHTATLLIQHPLVHTLLLPLPLVLPAALPSPAHDGHLANTG